MSMPEHIKIGCRGEQLAARRLRKNGYKILASNFFTRLGETDIIALDKEKTICFIEVKTRSPDTMLPPAEAVDRLKQERLTSNAAVFLKVTDVKYKAIRFDIIEVVMRDFFTADIRHIKDAFGYEE